MTGAPGFDVHPDMLELIAAKQAVPQTLDPAAMRAGWNVYGSRLGRHYPPGMAVWDTLARCPGAGTDGEVPIRIYRPKAAPDPSPCVVYLHGGAFVKGSLDSGDGVAWGLADEVGAVCVSVDYRLAPDHPYPAALEDCHAVLRYLAEHGAEHGIDRTRLALWGDSAGGNLAAATCLLARDRGGPPIAGQGLAYPCLTDELTSSSYLRYADSPGLQTALMDACWGYYLGADRPTREPYAAPLKAPDLARLPPAHVHYAEIDPLADDGIAYAERLREAGNEVTLRCARRMIHGFMRARFFGPGAAAEFAAAGAFLRRVLGLRA